MDTPAATFSANEMMTIVAARALAEADGRTGPVHFVPVSTAYVASTHQGEAKEELLEQATALAALVPGAAAAMKTGSSINRSSTGAPLLPQQQQLPAFGENSHSAVALPEMFCIAARFANCGNWNVPVRI